MDTDEKYCASDNRYVNSSVYEMIIILSLEVTWYENILVVKISYR